MRKILLSGYYGEYNTGDDVLLASASWGCNQFLQSNKILATSVRIPSFEKELPVLPLYVEREKSKSENLVRLYYHALTSNMIVFGGGSVFHSTDKLTRDADLIDLSRGEAAIALGVSFGPFRDSGAEQACKKFINKLSYIGVRDEDSFNIVKSLAPDLNIEKTFDLAPLFPFSQQGNNLNNSSSKRRGLAISLCHYERYIGLNTDVEKRRFEKILNVLNRLTLEDVEELIFIDFNGHRVLGDFDIHSEIIKKLNTEIPVTRIPYQHNPAVVLNLISRCRGIVGMRLHSCIFGYMTETPTVILSYHPKCMGWAKEIQANTGFTIDSTQFEEEQLYSSIMNILHDKYIPPILPLPNAQKLAMKNWEGALCSVSQ
ncbi:polysaccharide pyruvyl transferase family protein [Metabacillus sp. B2-18]|uniref:polysaccharide pyruvyl transferase family protein n=1 Tax=Metabacillus sp. B2-18 TaxID=2897333 RepID=UPI001E31857D|nr:polysaccharide pyruvyl transferase family protein [Metabacillus sp. B2-18]UGB28718.1 polysaccharide pyruvyl transferase family protein [Metabacillus sp. B2-18]